MISRREAPAMSEESKSRIWFDTEFIEDGTTIDLISIGMVRSDGATYYAETDQWIPGKASQWVKDNVIVHLKGGDCIKPRDVIAREIVEFAGEKPEFWAYYADYDWVALCQLFGTMMQLPDGWPMFCRDIKQWAVDLGDPKLPEQTSTEHHALADALWNKEAWDSIAQIAASRADIAEQMAEALRSAIRVADEAREEWDKAPSGMKAGKLLIALSNPDLKYRADITTIHAALSAWEASNQRTATDDEIVEMTSREAALGPEDASNTAQQEEPRNDG
jgi:hypothetical protein